MTEHRAQPSKRKSQRNAERHFRLTPYTIAKCDGNFTHAQRPVAAHNRLENNFEPARVWRQRQQPRTRNSKETAHRESCTPVSGYASAAATRDMLRRHKGQPGVEPP